MALLDFINSKVNAWKNSLNDNRGFVQQGRLTAQPITSRFQMPQQQRANPISVGRSIPIQQTIRQAPQAFNNFRQQGNKFLNTYVNNQIKTPFIQGFKNVVEPKNMLTNLPRVAGGALQAGLGMFNATPQGVGFNVGYSALNETLKAGQKNKPVKLGDIIKGTANADINIADTAKIKNPYLAAGLNMALPLVMMNAGGLKGEGKAILKAEKLAKEGKLPKVQGKLYQTINEGNVIKSVEGRSVKIIDGVDTFIHQGDNPKRTIKGFIVSEKSTGRYLGSGETERQAIANAKTAIQNVGEPKFKQLIAENQLSKPKVQGGEVGYHSTDKIIEGGVIKAGATHPQNYLGDGVYLGSHKGVYPGVNTYDVPIPKGLKILDLTQGNKAKNLARQVSQKTGLPYEPIGQGLYEDLRLMASKAPIREEGDIAIRQAVDNLTKGYDAVKSPLAYEGQFEIVIRKPEVMTQNFYNQSKGAKFVDNRQFLKETKKLGISDEVVKGVKMKVKGSNPVDSFINDLETSQSKLQQEIKLPEQVIQEAQSKKSLKEPILPPEAKSSFDNIIDSAGTNVKNKVNALDYLFTTPKNVLKKMGLPDVAKDIQKADEGYQTSLRAGIEQIKGWIAKVPDQASSQKIFQYLDGQKGVKLAPNELKIANEIKSYLAGWADKLGLPQDKRIAEYITHVFDFNSVQKEFDPEIAKIIQDKIPGSVYNPFLEQRLGKLGFKQDVWSALEAYVKRATRKSSFDSVLSKISTIAEQVDPETSKYLQRYASGINMRPSEVENLLDNVIKQSPIGYDLGQRPTIYLANKWRQMVGKATLGLNVGSAVRNLSQGVNTFAKLGPKYTMLGYGKLVKKMSAGDMAELVANNVFDETIALDRVISARKRITQGMDKVLFSLFDMAEKINRGSAYFGAKAKALANGKSEKSAIDFAKSIVQETQFKYGPVDSPPLMQRSIGRTVGQFMTYPIKQTEFLGNLVKNKEWDAIVRYIAAATTVVLGVGKTFGIQANDFVPWLQNLQSGRFGSPLVQTGQSILKNFSSREQTRSEGQKELKNSWRLLVPGGTQLNKTIQGLSATNRGYTTSPSGRVQTPVGTGIGNKIQAGIMGKYSLPEVNQYYKTKGTPLGDNQSEIFKNLSQDERVKYFGDVMQERATKREDKTIKQSIQDGTPLPTEKQSLMDRLLNRQPKETKATTGLNEYYNNGKIYYKADDKAKTMDLSKYLGEAPTNALSKAKWEDGKLSAAIKLYSTDGISEDTKKTFIKRMGLEYNNIENEAIKKLSDATQARYLNDIFQSKDFTQDKLDGFIDNGVLTSNVVSKMQDQGLISLDEETSLKAYIKARNVKTGKSKGKKPKKLTAAKISAVKPSRAKIARGKRASLGTQKIQVKMPKVKRTYFKANTGKFTLPPLPKLKPLQ